MNLPEATISVALCTYNGERFLPFQLESILEQSRLPDEVIACDDRSTDATLQILQDFAKRAPFPVEIVQNDRTLGSTKNFVQAINRCTGTLIALSDQDDLWQRTRLEQSEQELTSHPEVALLFSNADLINDQGERLAARLWERVGFSTELQQQLAAGDYSLCVRSRFVTGATVMFRASIRDRCLPVGEGWIHDEWLGAAAPLFAELRAIKEPLISYRVHAAQQIGPVRKPTFSHELQLALAMFSRTDVARERHWNQIAETATRSQVLCDHFAYIPLGAVGASRMASYRDFIEFLRFRQSLPPARLGRLMPVFHRRAAYRRYAGLGSLFKDLLLDHARVAS